MTYSETPSTIPSTLSPPQSRLQPVSHPNHLIPPKSASISQPTTTSSSVTKAVTMTTKRASKTTHKNVDDDSELLIIPIDPGVILRLRYVSASRQNFATNLMCKLFPKAERENSNVNGILGKSALDKDKIEYIRSVTFKMYPLERETEESAWGKCRVAIDEAKTSIQTEVGCTTYVLNIIIHAQTCIK